MEYNIDNKYIILMQQRIQTTLPQIINRIEIGRLKCVTKDYLILEGGRRVKKIFNKETYRYIKYFFCAHAVFIDRMEDALV